MNSINQLLVVWSELMSVTLFTSVSEFEITNCFCAPTASCITTEWSHSLKDNVFSIVTDRIYVWKEHFVSPFPYILRNGIVGQLSLSLALLCVSCVCDQRRVAMLIAKVFLLHNFIHTHEWALYHAFYGENRKRKRKTEICRVYHI